MIKRLLAIVGLAFFLFAFVAFEQGVICHSPIDQQFSINQVRARLVGGEWQYSHSVFKDTCFVIADLGFLPKSMIFENRSDSTFILEKEWLAARKSAYFRNIACSVTQEGKEERLLTFPSGSGKFSADSIIDGYPMFHLPASKRSGMTRKVTYDLLSVVADTMITRTGYVMEIRGKGEWNIHHIFYRKPLQ